MTLVLDQAKGGGGVSLFSGAVKVARVTFDMNPPPPVATIAAEISGLNLGVGRGASSLADASAADAARSATANFAIAAPDVISAQGQQRKGGSRRQSATHASPLPSTHFATSSRPASAASSATLPFSPTGISPVASNGRSGHASDARVTAIGRTALDSANLHLANGTTVRIRLPRPSDAVGAHSTPLVAAALAASCTLNRADAAASAALRARWFALRHAPGPTSISPNREWHLFTQCLLSLIGYQTDQLNLFPMSQPTPGISGGSPEMTSSGTVATKKQRVASNASDGDWDFLLDSVHHLEAGKGLSELLGLKTVSRLDRTATLAESDHEDDYEGSSVGVAATKRLDSRAPLFSCLSTIFFNLHLLYEDMKLDRCMASHLPYLCGLLYRIATDLRLSAYVAHYAKDFPELCPTISNASGDSAKEEVKKMIQGLPPTPPDIRAHLKKLLVAEDESYSQVYHYVSAPVSLRSRNIILCYAVVAGKHRQLPTLLSKNDPAKPRILKWLAKTPESRPPVMLVRLLAMLDADARFLDVLALDVALPLRSALNQVRNSASVLSPRERTLIDREDLADCAPSPSANASSAPESVTPSSDEDGMEDLETCLPAQLLWPSDRRLADARSMLASSSPVAVSVAQRPEVSDHEFVEEQERCLHAICVRTMALPVGRGALTLFLTRPLLSEPLAIPKLCLSGKAPPRGAAVDMEHIDIVPNMDRWPLFHNGVAAGLRVSPLAKGVDSTWIMFNRPKEKDNPNLIIEHGGLLLALGLNGHLAKLGKLESFDYLLRGHELLSIGVLLGLAASKRGSADVTATKKISTQLVALLPPSATELPISQATQTAALIGVGLLYKGTGHRHMTEMCLSELGRPPGPELENCTDREGYSLAAGLALGMITLGKGNELSGGSLSDLNVADLLYYHMIGGPRSAVSDVAGGGGLAGRFFSSNGQTKPNTSFQVKEGDTINIDVSGPGATLALGMMFFDSGNRAVADWMEAPATQHLLEFVRPDFLMLRTLAKGLILWSDIVPTREWLESHVPAAVRPYCMVRPDEENHPKGLDYETLNQAYCNIISGAALVMGIKFAGSNNAQAFQTLLDLTHRLVAVSKRSLAALAGRATVEQAICTSVLSLAVVAAGSGDLEVLRIIRMLRARVGTQHSTVTYGSHLALGLALGLLFAGGGRLTLATDADSVAALVCALYPKFPTHSNDNRYHLQALRHLYVLACEPRLLVPVDAVTGSHEYVGFDVEYSPTPWYPRLVRRYQAPMLLPEMKWISKVSINDVRYHTRSFEGEEGLKELKTILEHHGGRLNTKQKAGHLPHRRDSLGFRSFPSKLRVESMRWAAATVTSAAASALSEPALKALATVFLANNPQRTNWLVSKMSERVLLRHREGRRQLSSMLVDSTSAERLAALHYWMEVNMTPCGKKKQDLLQGLEMLEEQQGGEETHPFASPELGAAATQLSIACAPSPSFSNMSMTSATYQTVKSPHSMNPCFSDPLAAILAGRLDQVSAFYTQA